MTLSNIREFKILKSILWFALICIILDVAFSLIQGSIGTIFSNHILLISSAGVLLTFAILRINYFSYEDEYEIVHIVYHSLVFGFFQGKSSINFEFPKRTVTKVELVNSGVRKKLNIKLETQQGEKRLRSFDVSFLKADALNEVLTRLETISQRNSSSDNNLPS